MRERGVSQSPDYAQECINSSKHLLPGLLIHPCLSRQRSPRPTGGEEGFQMSGGCRRVIAHQETHVPALDPTLNS